MIKLKLIDGKLISSEIKESLKNEIIAKNIKPGLAIIMVGNNPASEVYVRNKLKACEYVGISAVLKHFDENVSEEEIIDCIKKMNEDRDIHGIIVQSPLPSGFDEAYITSFIDSAKDVDGFGTANLGALASGEEEVISATPYGIIKILEYENITIEGKNVVIVGRSKIVGRPLALALLNRNATVTIAHSKSKNLKEITKNADILVVAIGKANFITKDHIKDGAVVIDVGINRLDNGKLCGDVDVDSIKNKVGYLTPVPGGVGPMTIAMLLKNTVESCEKNMKKEEKKTWTKELKKH